MSYVPSLFCLRGACCPLLLVALVAGPSSARAVETITIGDPESLVVQHLIRSYDLHVDAAADMVDAIGPAQRPNSTDLGKLAHRWRQATVAWLDYSWADRGRGMHRTYHGISGKDAQTVLGLDSVGRAVSRPEAPWRLASPRPHVSSVLGMGEAIRSADAEAKLMRSLESDILDGKLPRGGRVRMWVSQEACASCSAIAQHFESAYGSRITIYELARGARDDPTAAFSRLDTHRKEGFRRLRDRIAVREGLRLGIPQRRTAGCLP